MITITEKAADHMLNVLVKEQADERDALRITGEPGAGYGVSVDHVRDGDNVFQLRDRKLLVVESRLAERMGEVTIDVMATDTGPQLALYASEEP
jgi:Fe-S cluster assembly iron-binding protein IscA